MSFGLFERCLCKITWVLILSRLIEDTNLYGMQEQFCTFEPGKTIGRSQADMVCLLGSDLYDYVDNADCLHAIQQGYTYTRQI